MENGRKVVKTVKRVSKLVAAIPFILKTLLVFTTLLGLISFLDFVIEIFQAKNTPQEILTSFEVEDLKEVVEIKESPDGSGYYLDFIEDYEEKIEEVIHKMNNRAGVHNLPRDTSFVKKIIKAELVTQFPNLGGNIPEDSDGFQGAIDIRRITPNKEIGDIDDNPGRGETTNLEPETIYDPADSNNIQEARVESWEEGKTLWIIGNAIVYEQAESKLNPGSDTGYWEPKIREGTINDYETIEEGTEVTYTGTYKKSTNPLSKETIIYVEISIGEEKKFVRATSLMINKEEEKEEEESQETDIQNRTIATSRAESERSQTKYAGNDRNEQFRIAIAAGHNNTENTGARNEDLVEEEMTIKVAEKVEELLKEYSNVEVIQVGSTSENPSNVKVSDRTTLARNADPDLCIQIHFNSGGGTGVEAIYKDGDEVSRQLAEMLSESMANSMGLTNRGAGSDLEKCAVGSLGIIENYVHTGFPSVVTEGGFLDGEPDATLLRSEGTDTYAQGIVDGILKYLKADHSGYTSVSIENQSAQSSVNSKVYNLKYVTPQQMETYINSGDLEALKTFTLDEENSLVTVTWEKREDGVIELKKNASMNFRTTLQKHVMPYEYLLYFYIDSDRTDFSEKLADKVLDTEIVIAVQDNITTTETTDSVKQKKEASMPEYSYDWREVSSSTKVVETCTPTIEVTYADTWCAKFYKENSYSSRALNWQEGETEKILDIQGQVNETSNSYSSGVRVVVNDAVGSTGREDENGNAIQYTYDIYERTDTTTNTMSIQYNSGSATVVGNENKFVSVYQDTEIYKELKESYLFTILENNDKTANLVDLTKYLMYEATGNNYGVVEFEFESLFEQLMGASNAVGGDYVVHTEKGQAVLKITDIETLKRAFSGYSRSEKLMEHAQDFLNMQEQYKVNAIFAAAVSITETGAGRAGNATNGLNNWYNIRGNGTTWRSYSSPSGSIDDFGALIANGSYYFNAGKYTVSEIGAVYCPNEPEHPTQADDWVEAVRGYMTNMYNAAGIDISSIFNTGSGGAIGKVADLVAWAESYVGSSQYPHWSGGYRNAYGTCAAFVKSAYYYNGFGTMTGSYGVVMGPIGQRGNIIRNSDGTIDWSQIPTGAYLVVPPGVAGSDGSYGHTALYVGNGYVIEAGQETVRKNHIDRAFHHAGYSYWAIPTGLKEYMDSSEYKSLLNSQSISKSGRGYTTQIAINGKTYNEYKQTSPDYAGISYWGGSFANNACGPTSLGIIASGYGINEDPVSIANYMNNRWGYTSPSFVLTTLKEKLNLQGTYYNGTGSGTSKSQMTNIIRNHLRTGKPMIIDATPGRYTTVGHYMTLLGMNDKGEVYLCNPASSRQNGWVDLQYLLEGNGCGRCVITIDS